MAALSFYKTKFNESNDSGSTVAKQEISRLEKDLKRL
jgi:hypothetical protein